MPLPDPVIIASFARTPLGGFRGALADVSATELGATAVKAAVERAGVDPRGSIASTWAAFLPPGSARLRRGRRR